MFFRRLAPPLFALFAGAVFLYPRMAPTSDPTDVPQVKHSSSANDVTRDRLGPTESEPSITDFPTARDLISKFLFLDASDHASRESSAGDYSIEFLIATVPDPIESRLPRFFDSFVESLQRAAEAAGYTIDRIALPWPENEKAEHEIAGAYGESLDALKPGLMLFRDPGKQKLLLIFLVGETPTAGIHKHAMLSALDQVAQFHPQGHQHADLPQGFPALNSSESQDTIRIMGPSFSGSAVSLRFTLEQWTGENNPNWKFEIISGTATAIHRESLSPRVQGTVSFQAAVPPDDETLQAVACYIADLGYQKIAILTESNTAYGQNASNQGVPGTNGTKSSHPAGCANGQSIPEILSLPFPMHISRLRAASMKATASPGQAGQGTGSSSPASAPLAEGSASEPREVLPAFSDLDVQSTELTLANLLSTIAREQYSYVGIIATDVRDVTFLAQEVRKHCPATVLFTLNSDLLYAYPDVNSATHGMIVITPYPLFNLEQLWTYAYGGGRSRLQFSDQAAEGVYNATLALLHQDGKLVDYGKPLTPSTNTQSAESHQPSLWVTAIGSAEALPVRLLEWKDDAHYTYSPTLATKEKRSWGKPTVGRGIYAENAVVAVIVLSILLSAFSFLIISQYRRTKGSVESRTLAWLSDTVSPAYWSECRLFLICSCVSLLAFYVVVVVAFSLPFVAGSELGTGIQTTATPIVALCIAAVTVVLLALAIHALVSSFRAASSGQRGSAPEVIIVTFLSCALVFFLAFLLAFSWVREVRAYAASGFFNHLRSFDFAGGLSPLLPLSLVALAACLWALCSFRRLKLLDILRATATTDRPHAWLSFLSLDVRSFSGVRELEDNIRHTLESSTVISLKGYATLMVIVLNIWIYFFYHRLVRALEVRPFYWLFGAAFFIAYWALLMEFLRLVFTWRTLNLLLQRLSWLPLLAGFKRYRESRPNLAKMNLTHPPSSFAALESSVNQAGRLVRAARKLAQSPAVERVSELVRQSLPTWEAQLQAAGSQLCVALQLQWADDLQAEPISSLETARKMRASPLRGDWRQSLRARYHAHKALFQLLQSLGKPMEEYWSCTHAEGAAALLAAETREFFDEVEQFVVSRVVNFLAVVFPSLQNIAFFVLAGLLLMLLAVTSYPFQPRDEFLFFNWVVILSFIATVFWIFIQMDRDTVLSLLNDSKPGEISFNRELVLRALLYLAVPLLALFGAQFPEIVRQVLSIFTTTQASP